MSTTSSSRNANVKCFVNGNRKKSNSVSFIGKASSMKEMTNKPIYQAMILKMYRKNKSRNENKSTLINKRSIYSVDSINGSNINNVSYIQSSSTRYNGGSCSFHIPNFAKILLNQKQNDFSYIKNNTNNYRNNSIFSVRNSVNVNKVRHRKAFVEVNEESLSYTNKTTRLRNENRNITNKKCINEKRNNKSPNKNLTYNSSEYYFMKKRANSSINISEMSNEPDTEGPEEFHFMLVDVLSKQKKAMIKLSYQLHIKNEGVDVNYLD